MIIWYKCNLKWVKPYAPKQQRISNRLLIRIPPRVQCLLSHCCRIPYQQRPLINSAISSHFSIGHDGWRETTLTVGKRHLSRPFFSTQSTVPLTKPMVSETPECKPHAHAHAIEVEVAVPLPLLLLIISSSSSTVVLATQNCVSRKKDFPRRKRSRVSGEVLSTFHQQTSRRINRRRRSRIRNRSGIDFGHRSCTLR